MFAIFALFVLRMYQLQIAENEEWQLLADDNRISEIPVPAPRGVIFDRNGKSLAINVPAYNVEIIPAGLPGTQEEDFQIFNRLSALVDVPPTNAAAQASRQNTRSIEDLVDEGERIAPYRPVIIAQDVDLRVAMQIMEQSITMPGVSVRPIAVREYPTGALTSQIVGYMGPIPAEEAQTLIEEGYNPAFDRIGYAGVEFFLEDIIGGRRGTEIREVDVAGLPIRTLGRVDYVAGQNVRLTIDIELQQAAENALRDQITLVNTRAGNIVTQTGVVIAMNPRTGEILAMVSWPSYDNSRFARAIDYEYYLDVFNDPLTPLVNHAISSLYPPGSVWKIVSAAGVLEENVIDPRTKLLDPGSLVVENKYAPNDPAASQRFVCWKPDGHGEVDMWGGIAQSCDVYFYQVGGGNNELSPAVLRPGGLGPTDLFRYATAFGIGAELGVELPGEQAGRMPDPDWKRRTYGENWSTGDTYNAAFGQGYLTVTPLQLINAVAVVANNGVLYQPTVINSFLDPEGNVTQPFQPNVMRTLNLETLGTDDPIVLLQIEDMIMKGPSSLACTCEPDADNEYYNPLRCDPDNYRNTVDINPDQFVSELQEYRVHIPLNYVFNGRICDERRFNPNYQPPFITSSNLQIVREGMRQAVTIGTAQGANLSYIEVTGKTGTAEYCDDIARPLGLCVPGNWPAHAWFTAYAPYENPEILIIGFVYNGGEGSAVALPVVVRTMEAYLRLKNAQPEALPVPSVTFPTPTP